MQLVAVLFHELAHQVIYVKGDTTFNESFASAVEEAGVVRWLEHRGELALLDAHNDGRAVRQTITYLVAAAREDLAAIFDRPLSESEMRAQKKQRLDDLRNDIVNALRVAGRDTAAWERGTMNNARLVPIALYDTWLPAFRVLLQQCHQEFSCFYDAVRSMAELSFSEREARLRQLM